MEKVLCPICKLLVDTSKKYEEYRKTSAYKAGAYPDWCYADNLPEHMLNFHKLPEIMAEVMALAANLAQHYKTAVEKGARFRIYIQVHEEEVEEE